MESAVDQKRATLPPNAQGNEITQIYWVLCALHKNWYDIDMHLKNNLAIESNCKVRNNMRMIKIKNDWDTQDSNLVVNGRFTSAGNHAFWRTIDSAIAFNIHKREEYVIMDRYHKLMADRKARRPLQLRADGTPHDHNLLTKDSMNEFFRRHQNQDHDNKYCWTKPQKLSHNKFFLPHPDR